MTFVFGVVAQWVKGPEGKFMGIRKEPLSSGSYAGGGGDYGGGGLGGAAPTAPPREAPKPAPPAPPKTEAETSEVNDADIYDDDDNAVIKPTTAVMMPAPDSEVMGVTMDGTGW
jgi:hypothetical protein